MRILAALFVAMQLMLVPVSVQAQDWAVSRVIKTETWIEEWDPHTENWVRIDGSEEVSHEAAKPQSTHVAARYAVPIAPARPPAVVAQYGPFQVLSEDRAAIVGPTNRMSPLYFEAMLRDFPAIATLDMLEAPGTSDDIANLTVGRMIRAADIATHVPRTGSVRSGAVELFLAGVTRTMDDGAEFAVHSWLDSYGREPGDFHPEAPENRLYIDYYVEMGMKEGQARRFYAMTNSVPHHSARWLGAEEMRGWIAPQKLEKPRVQTIGVQFANVLVQPRLQELALTTLPYLGLAEIPPLVYADISASPLASHQVHLDSEVAFP